MKSTRGKAYIFPLFLINNGGDEIEANFQPAFLEFLQKRYGLIPEARSIFAYIYALLNAPTYCASFGDMLRKSFPRVIFPQNFALFTQIACKGEELLNVHLGQKLQCEKKMAEFPESGTNFVARNNSRYESGLERVYLNPSQYWVPVPTPIWETTFGGWPFFRTGCKNAVDGFSAPRKLQISSKLSSHWTEDYIFNKKLTLF